jgi:integrase
MPLKLYRPDGSDLWYYSGTVAGDRLRGSTRTKDKKVAARVAAKIESEHYKGRLDGPQKVLTFPKAVELYESAGKIGNFRTAAYVRKLEDYWKDAYVKDITAGAIRQSAIMLYKGMSGATWNRQVITPTQAIINHCAELDLCAPIRVKRFAFDKKIKPPITLEWLDAFCAHAPPRIAALATFMFATGCRISEARRVEWTDIDFPNRAILVRMTKTKRQRLSHIPARLLVALANLPRDKAPFGQPETALRRAWDGTVEAAGIQRLTFHSCRHGFATTLLQGGVDVVTVAKLGGWDSPQQVLATYAHAMQDATLTDQLFDKQCQTPGTPPKLIQGLTEK